MNNKYLEKQQKPIEIILFRQISSLLGTPSFIVDKNDTVIFCNEPAEEILGIKFSERGEISALDWSKIFKIKENQGRITIESKEGKFKEITLTKLPIVSQMKEILGSIIFFEGQNK